MQHLNTRKQQLRALSLQIIIHRTHAPVHRESHRTALHCTALHVDVRAGEGAAVTTEGNNDGTASESVEQQELRRWYTDAVCVVCVLGGGGVMCYYTTGIVHWLDGSLAHRGPLRS
jgi:hypothetical protein